MTMTPLIYMLALIISIVILLVLTLKLKMNSFMALFFTAMGLSVFFGTSPIESLNNITGFWCNPCNGRTGLRSSRCNQ